ncbi:hypothetical protein NIES4073_06070 [Kalymmatonema gypsitolerans NIES-4073]|uniref:hypothetical protein n=1 Tax=Scytonema sp. PRP1 TaxID=3120513 RepID=UPI000B5ECBBF|nr:hypothetical protein NIES4073_06070 [Scytonema sp. NIES-4073]
MVDIKYKIKKCKKSCVFWEKQLSLQQGEDLRCLRGHPIAFQPIGITAEVRRR